MCVIDGGGSISGTIMSRYQYKVKHILCTLKEFVSPFFKVPLFYPRFLHCFTDISKHRFQVISEGGHFFIMALHRNVYQGTFFSWNLNGFLIFPFFR